METLQDIFNLTHPGFALRDPIIALQVYYWVKENPDIDINQKYNISSGETKTTLLHLACGWGPKRLVEAILQHPKCNANTLSDSNLAALDIASMYSDLISNARVMDKYGAKHGPHIEEWQLSWSTLDELKHNEVMVLLFATKLPRAPRTQIGTLPSELFLLIDRLLIARYDFVRHENEEFEEAYRNYIFSS